LHKILALSINLGKRFKFAQLKCLIKPLTRKMKFFKMQFCVRKTVFIIKSKNVEKSKPVLLLINHWPKYIDIWLAVIIQQYTKSLFS